MKTQGRAVRSLMYLTTNLAKKHFLPTNPVPIQYGPNFWKYYFFLRKSQWYSVVQFEKYQLKMLKALLAHAYECVPYYHRVLTERNLRPDNFKTITDLEKIPVLTKEDVRKNFADLLATSFDKYRTVLAKTGGSTGFPLKFYVDRNTIDMENAIVWRFYNWAGCQFWERFADFFFFEENLSWKYNPFINSILFSPLRMTKENIDNWIDTIRRFCPVLLHGYPSILYILALSVLNKGITNIRPRAVATSSEVLTPMQREVIEEAFNCKVFDYYGMNERTAAAGECGMNFGYHVFSERAIVEIAEGESQNGKGEIIGTCLTNYAMPLIRYASGDICTLVRAGTVCPCQRKLPLIRSIEGRVGDMILTPDGRIITPALTTRVFREFGKIRNYQIIQENINKIILRLVPQGDLNEHELERISKATRKFFGDEIDIRIELVSMIERTRLGKCRLTVSNIPHHELEDFAQ